MRAFVRVGATALALVVAIGLACKDSGAPGVASSLTRVSGDTQAMLTGEQLSIPLSVRVKGSDGQPVAGATVTWTVSTGSATPGTPTVLSDSQGLASTTLTVGATPGAIGIQASVPGLTPLTFNATGCAHPVLALNDTVLAALTTTDCRFSGYYTGFYTDFYELTVAAPSQGVVLTEVADALAPFDTYLELFQASGSFVGYDDDIDTLNQNSELTAILGPGDYLLAPSSYLRLTTGGYTMAALTKPAGLAGCGIVWVTGGVDISDSVVTGDCVDSTNGRYYADVVAMHLVAGTTLNVNHRSTAFNAALFLFNGAGTEVASNNDSAATTTNAFMSFPVVASGDYLLFAGTNDSLVTGVYDLSIAATTTLAGSPRQPGPQVLRLGGLRWPKGRARSWSRARAVDRRRIGG